MRRLIHIGGNKTASTSLQRRLFAKHPRIRYLGEDCEGYAELRPILDSLVADDDSHFDFGTTKRLFDDRFGGQDGNAACVYSNEDIMTSSLPSVCASRLKVLLPGAEVVMVIRNQLSVWPSWYANHGAYLKNVPRRYWKRHVGLDEWLDFCFSFPRKTPVEAMNYERFFKIFEKEFSAERIHVLLYEDLLEDAATFFQQWAHLLEISEEDIVKYMAEHVERRRNTGRRMAYDRWVSRLSMIPGFTASQRAVLRLLPAVNRWIDDGPPAKVLLPAIWEQRVSDYYRHSNSNLAKLTGLNLARHGYPL
jgi:hypothetical protein